MKILAIRGENLASLAGPFAVEFQQEPLASTGLFAICGPTGAGKSTLLDALCMALYEKTPRLKAAAADVGQIADADVSITTKDVRNLLRRGTGEGYAEVDFEGNDGVAYRSRWTVRRARRKVTGRLAKTEMQLLQVADEQVVASGNKTDVLKVIEEKIGLTFEQFTRSVLLAQNEFFAFLKAGEDERAMLLQALTGTDHFARISMRAHARNREEQKKVERIQMKLEDGAPLDAEARAQLKTERDAQHKVVAELEQTVKQIEKQLAWFAEWEQAGKREEETRTKHSEALTSQEQAAERRAKLHRVEAVQAARPLVTDVDRLGKECETLTAQRDQLAKEMAAQDKEIDASEKKYTAAKARAQEAEAVGKKLAPMIKEAYDLDSRVRALAPGLNELERQVTEQKAAVDALRKEHGEAHVALANIRKEFADTEAWLGKHAAREKLAGEWLRWDGLFQTATGEHRAQQTCLAEVRRLVLDVGRQEALVAVEEEKAKHAATELEAAKGILAEAGKVLDGLDRSSFPARKREVEQRRKGLVDLRQHWETLVRERDGHAELVKQGDTLRGALDGYRKLLAGAVEQKAVAQTAAERAERDYEVVHQACGETAESLREALVEGDPCSVCGSVEHPWHKAGAELAERLTALRDERDRCRDAFHQIQQTEKTQTELIRKDEATLNDVGQRLSEVGKRLAEAEASWQDHPLMREVADVPDADRAAWFTAALDKVDADLKALEAEDERYTEATKARDAAQKRVNDLQASSAVAAKAFEDAGKVLADLRHESKNIADKQRSSGQRLADTLAALEPSLEPLLADWRELWEADPAAFHRARQDEALAWRRHKEQYDKLSTDIQTATVSVDALAKRRDDAVKQHEALEKQFHKDRQESADLESARGRLFVDTAYAGKPTDEVETLLQQSLETTAKTVEEQRVFLDGLKETHRGLAGRLEQIRSQLGAQEKALGVATTALDEWMASFRQAPEGDPLLDAQGLRTLLAFSVDWIRMEREALRKLDEDVEACRRLVEDKRKERDAVDARRPTEASKDEVTARHEESARRHGEEQKALSALDVRLATDDDRLKRAGSLLQELEKQQEIARLWGQLDHLIGSADGKKFRNYAQRMTLDILLQYANVHLRDLARRYRLERNEDSLGLLVIDQDMGDEVRSVHSLSGGESFLVSLALALGLASLSSNRVPVGSLFIDEGFGSLDADTLRMAMDALDSLQAQGRKVGVISHVQEMTERIGVRVDVVKQPGSRSRVDISGSPLQGPIGGQSPV